MTINSVAATLIIGIPSVAIALATLWFSRRAHHQQMTAARVREHANGITAEADAYTRARVIDESAIADLRRQIDSLRAEVDHGSRELDAARTRMAQAQAVIDELRTTIAMFRSGGQA